MNGLSHARIWHVVDAKDKILGRLAMRISIALRGKYKPNFNPQADLGDYVVVKNCSKIYLTGNKFTDKKYHWHTGYPGGLKSKTFKDMIHAKPTEPIRRAVYGMLPKNKLRKVFMSRLFLFPGEEHPYEDNKLKIYDENAPVVPINQINK